MAIRDREALGVSAEAERGDIKTDISPSEQTHDSLHSFQLLWI
jgi:hypothetical protein